MNPVTGRDAVFQHAAFGAILGEDGRPFKTRSGESVKLSDLLDETAARALAAVTSRSPDMPVSEAKSIAEAVGMASLKYADLCNDRIKDYVFSFDRMLAFEGNTGPYLLYALVRIRSIFRKAAERGLIRASGPTPTKSGPSNSPQPAPGQCSDTPYAIREPQEKTLALTLLRYPATVRAVAEALEPHRLCQYLYDLAGAFSSFFDACPVLQAEDAATRNARLRLCDLTARVLADGLSALGIPTVDRM